ncbi:facilitated trehalose transporter Tret1-like [Bicyclus anynana]|uniref:Facilitated trehalose transporter Tret1-like n=1 Tax=Bicyclus anynana TaxID=110368 RepID=A0A6J1N3M5_BICAN|nr:facilitated trehalose transporter Tret1-like [Bicyclus anynana]
MAAFSDVYFWRQSIVLTADCLHSIGTGFMMSYPAVLQPAILTVNSTDVRATANEASWIAASHGLAGMLGFLMVPYLMQTLGRKTVHIGLNVFAGIGFLIFALAQSVPVLYVARVTQGLTLCGVYVTPIMLGEYSHPKRRGYFITLKKCSVAVGSLMCHSMALCWTWRQIAVFAIVPHIASTIITLMWPESPAFLALNGRYDECGKSHTWLHGDSPKNKKELEELIATQMERREKVKNRRNLESVMRKMLRKDFLKPFIIASLLTMLVDACGRYYMLAYVVEILSEVTGDKAIAAYCTMGADTLTIIALLVSCYVIRCCKRRNLLFTAGTTCVCLMFLTSIIVMLKTRHILGVSANWVTPMIILLNVFIVNVGVIPVCFAIIGEIFPLEHKGTGSCATGIVFTLLYALVMKFTPLMMEKTGVEGTFGIFGLFVLVGLVILYFILNETKDKTLQEIENEIRGLKKLIET